MTKTISKILFASLFAVSSAFAAGGPNPCKEIHAACHAGKASQAKGVDSHCFQRVLAGETLPGVTVSADQIAACKARKDKKAAVKAAGAAAAH